MTTNVHHEDNEEGAKMIPRPDVSVAQIVLLILSQAGRLTFRQVLSHSLVRELGAIRSENSFYTALARLKRRRLIIRTSDKQYELTPAGEYAALKAYVRKEFTGAEKKSTAAGKKTGDTSGRKEWDGRWRLVLFDIPESKRSIRDYIRNVLKRSGFSEFQRSMWIYPYKLPSFLTKLFADPQIRKYVRTITTYDIDYDEDLRRKFRLL